MCATCRVNASEFGVMNPIGAHAALSASNSNKKHARLASSDSLSPSAKRSVSGLTACGAAGVPKSLSDNVTDANIVGSAQQDQGHAAIATGSPGANPEGNVLTERGRIEPTPALVGGQLAAAPEIQIAASLLQTYNVHVAETAVARALQPEWLRRAVYPFQAKHKLPAPGSKWRPSNYRFAAYAQLARLVYEAHEAEDTMLARGRRLTWDKEGVVAACVRDRFPDAN